ncbi:MAG: hypothetical protein M3M85_02855 [bacterium]|nr:hypothetical protein [bacterium]
MDKIKNFFAHGIGRVIKWAFFILLAAYIVIVLVRVFQMFDADETEAQVAKIHATKLELSDVTGENLPPDPGALADETLAGVDANKNGIRDDVELAIFEAYPNSAKTRAALLQYALALQMQFTQPKINTIVVDKVIGEQSRARFCIADSLVPRKTPESERTDTDMEKIDNFINLVDDKQLNTEGRKSSQEEFYRYLGNFANSDKEDVCDIDLETLPN